MKKKKIISKLNYQPSKLQAHQLDSPFKVMDFFFNDFPIHEARSNLWELYRGWVLNSAQYANEQTIKDMLCFYTQFSEFVDACYVHTMSKHKK